MILPFLVTYSTLTFSKYFIRFLMSFFQMKGHQLWEDLNSEKWIQWKVFTNILGLGTGKQWILLLDGFQEKCVLVGRWNVFFLAFYNKTCNILCVSSYFKVWKYNLMEKVISAEKCTSVLIWGTKKRKM